MRRHLALFVALASLVVSAPARAQRVDPGSPSRLGAADRAALLALAGPRARVRTDEDGHVRMLFGAHVLPWSGEPSRDALALTARFGLALGIPQGADLRVERAQTWHGFTIVRLRRFAEGRPVIGATVVVRFLADGAIDLVFADPGPASIERAPDAIESERALAIAGALQLGYPVRPLAAIPAALVVGDAILPIWQIDVHGPALSQRARALLDARDGRVLAIVPLSHDAQGRVYASNPTTDMDMSTDVELTDLTSTQYLTGSHFRVASCNAQTDRGCAPMQYAQADADGNFLFDASAAAYDDPFSEVSAYHHLSRAAAYHHDAHAFDWACGTQSVMRVFVNYTEVAVTPYDNAAFNPASGGECGFLLFGQGASSDFAYDGDVVYHEFGHAVTDQISGITGFVADSLGVSYEPLAVNEGTSDYWAGTIQGNPEIAESFAGLGGIGAAQGLRIIDNDSTCPGSLFGEGHEDGRLWGGVGWDLHEAIGAEAADAIMFTTVASMNEDPSLAEAGDLLLATAMGMETMGTLGAPEVAMVGDAITARGYPGCQRIVPLDDGEQRMGWSGSEFITASVGQSIAPVHYRIDVPADATSLTVEVSHLTFSGTYSVHLQTGRPVRVNAVRTYAQAVLPVADGVVLTAATSPLALPRCQTVYIAVQSTDLRTRGQNIYQIRAALERSGDPSATCPALPTDGGAPAADGGVELADAGDTVTPPSSGGCGCRIGERASHSPAMLSMLVLGLAIAIRRRR